VNDATKLDVCPACGQAAVYVRALDQYMHEDGSSNRLCWLRISRGEVVWQVIDSAGTWAWVGQIVLDADTPEEAARRAASMISGELWRRIKDAQFRVVKAPGPGGGWDVALIIDGTYLTGGKALKDELLTYWRVSELPALIGAVESK